MKEQSFSLVVYVLGYPIALTIMVAYYVSEVMDAAVRGMAWLIPVSTAKGRK